MPDQTDRLSRIALVIGNANYRSALRLRNTHADAQAVASALADVGFTSHLLDATGIPATLTAYHDLSQTGMNRLLAEFNVAARSADMAVIYYSGHGIEIGTENYLIPVEAEPENAVDVQYETVRLPSVIDAVAGAATLRLVVLDACRDNPFAGMKGIDLGKSIGTGLAAPGPTGSALVFYAAAEGRKAREGQEGGLSPFAQALSATLRTPGLELFSIFGKVTAQVRRVTNHGQEPRLYGAPLENPIYLWSSPATPVSEIPEPVTPPQPTNTSTVEKPFAERALVSKEEKSIVKGGNVDSHRRHFLIAIGGLATAAIIGVAILWGLQRSDVRRGDDPQFGKFSDVGSQITVVQRLRAQIDAKKIVFQASGLEQQLLGLGPGIKVTPRLQLLVLRLSELASPIQIASMARIGAGSHSAGRAVDIGNEQIARTLLPRVATQTMVDMLQIDEIIFDAAVVGEPDRNKWNFDQGRPHSYNESALVNYRNHIHFAVK